MKKINFKSNPLSLAIKIFLHQHHITYPNFYQDSLSIFKRILKTFGISNYEIPTELKKNKYYHDVPIEKFGPF